MDGGVVAGVGGRDDRRVVDVAVGVLVCVEQALRDAYEEQISQSGLWEPASGGRRSASGLRHQAWEWAQANRTPTGELPSGKAIAERFGRRERWGRLVKQTGHIEGWT